MRTAATVLLLCAAGVSAKLTTLDGRHDLGTIHLTVAYFVPKDRTPLPDWKERVDYFVRRIVAFHQRELDGQSTVKPTVLAEPVVATRPSADFRKGDQNRTFYDTMDAVRAATGWKPRADDGFPVLLVLSDINWRDLDDFRRARTVEGKEVFDGYVDRQGRHFPGAESGGSRAAYFAERGCGMGLVSADGWRVPYAGSDCVVYHEGLGHSISLPHPAPIDRSVMGTAQYEFWINQTHLNAEQKRRLGWTPPPTGPLDRSTDLFTHFTAVPTPPVPRPGEEIALELKWPAGAVVKSFVLRVQTEVAGEWVTVATDVRGAAPERVALGSFEQATPVGYRVNATLDDGQSVELRGYFQVR